MKIWVVLSLLISLVIPLIVWISATDFFDDYWFFIILADMFFGTVLVMAPMGHAEELERKYHILWESHHGKRHSKNEDEAT